MTLANDLTAIVARAQAGDREAFDTIYERFADPLYRYLYARCGDTKLSEDLTSTLWIRVVEHLPAFCFHTASSEEAFAAWLFTIARNLLRDWYRCSAHNQVSLTDLIPSTAPSLDNYVIKKEGQEQLSSAMQQLTPDQREVLLFRFREEYSIAEVARLTQRSEGAVKVLQHRAIRALSRIFAAQRGHE